MNIPTPVPIDNELNNRGIAYLPALSVAARKGYYQDAVAFAKSYVKLVNEDPRNA